MQNDLRQALRRLLGSPLASLTCIIAMALSIGMSTANYSVADALLFRPLPVAGLERVLYLGGQAEGKTGTFRPLSGVDYQAFRQAATLESAAVTRTWDATLTGSGEPLQVTGARVSAGFFTVMRIQPTRGNWFATAEEAPGADRSVVLTYKFWQRQFGSDEHIVGRDIELDGRKYTVSGVLPRGFNYPRAAEFLVPFAVDSAAWANDGSFYLQSVARLKDGSTLEQAREELSAIAARLAKQYPVTHAGVTTHIVPLRERASGDQTPAYTRLVLGCCLCLLLIACLNVANLRLARAVSRAREMAVRSALGASRWRLLRQALVESLLLAAAGAGVGLILAAWLLDGLRSGLPPEVERHLPGVRNIGLNGWVLFWTAATAAAAGLASGIGPALWLSRRPLVEGLHDSGRSSSGSRRQRLRTALVVLETALSLVLLVGAGLMEKSFRAIRQPDIELQPEHALTFRMRLPQRHYPTSTDVLRFQLALDERLNHLPGVTGAALVSDLPHSGSANYSPAFLEGQPAEDGLRRITQVQSISPGYLRTLGVPLLEGDLFSGSEDGNSEAVALVSQSFARQALPGQSAVGRRVHLGDGRWLRIVGVVGDVLHDFTDRVAGPLVYRPLRQVSGPGFDVVMRTAGAPLAVAPLARRAVRELDAAQPIARVRSYAKLINDNSFGIGYVAQTLSLLGAAALLLAVIGTYSVLAYAVGDRTKEFGIRLALGGTESDILWIVLRWGIGMAVVSLALGLSAGYAAARLLSGLIFGISASDATVFLAVPAALLLALAGACLLPARRATRTDPLIALRAE